MFSTFARRRRTERRDASTEKPDDQWNSCTVVELSTRSVLISLPFSRCLFLGLVTYTKEYLIAFPF